MLKKHPKNQCRSMLTALYLSPTIRPDYTPKPYHRTLPLYQTAPQNHTTVPHHTTKPYHCTTPYPKAVPQNFISWYPFVGSGLCEYWYTQKGISIYDICPYLGTGTGYGSGVRFSGTVFQGTVFGVRFWGTVLGYGFRGTVLEYGFRVRYGTVVR